MTKIGIIGCGFVGSAISEGFKDIAEIYRYDIDPVKKTHEIHEIVNICDFVFICLPTPMTCAEGGDADLSIIFDFFEKVNNPPLATQEEIDDISRQLQNVVNDPELYFTTTNYFYSEKTKRPNYNIRKDCVFIIKSTVPIGTTKLISEKYNIENIVHNPEFLTAKNALQDFLHPDRIVIGGEKDFAIEKTMLLYEELFYDHLKSKSFPVFIMSSDESEMVKYVANAFLATKVSFFNEMRLLSDKKNMNWKNIVDGVTSDKRIGKSHSIVPDDINERFWSGFCFPKDLNALIKSFEKEEIDPLLIKATWEVNKKGRKNWDWVGNPSSVSKEKKEKK